MQLHNLSRHKVQVMVGRAVSRARRIIMGGGNYRLGETRSVNGMLKCVFPLEPNCNAHVAMAITCEPPFF